MSSANSSPSSSARSVRRKPARKAASRPLSASEIARNRNHFELWSIHQNMDQSRFSDIPKHLKEHVDTVLDVKGRIPRAWLASPSLQYVKIAQICSPDFFKFLTDAHEACPELFTDNAMDDSAIHEMYDEVATVFKAWKHLRKMKLSGEKYSEADFAKACDLFRTPAITSSRQRGQCMLALPQPMNISDLCQNTVRILSAKTIIPDNVVFIPRSEISDLCESENSPFNTLKGHKLVQKMGTVAGSSFSFQGTPCSALPNSAGFEFASSVWEDKKPLHNLLEDAYRQNRMSTATVVRHLESLGVDAPVFGLVWANGTVRGHVDWHKNVEDQSLPSTMKILSASFPGDSSTSAMREWALEKPADILQVHFLIRNIDHWTCHAFKDIVGTGVNNRTDAIVNGKVKYAPWKRVGVLKVAKRQKENTISNNSISASPPRRKTRTRK